MKKLVGDELNAFAHRLYCPQMFTEELPCSLLTCGRPSLWNCPECHEPRCADHLVARFAEHEHEEEQIQNAEISCVVCEPDAHLEEAPEPSPCK